jgi:hypothetical protein
MVQKPLVKTLHLNYPHGNPFLKKISPFHPPPPSGDSGGRWGWEIYALFSPDLFFPPGKVPEKNDKK